MEHSFTTTIRRILENNFAENSELVFEKSLLLQYINEKTKSADRGSKARSGFASLYAIYVIVEDYIGHGFDRCGSYSKYDGAIFVNLFNRQRELPFGGSLQNHALNNRLNAEFAKFFPTSEFAPIIRDLETNRYWINENLIVINIGADCFNIAKTIIEIIDEYARVKRDSFKRFIGQCETLQRLDKGNNDDIHNFIFELLEPNVDARLFEIVSYAILKFYYKDRTIIWGYDIDHLKEEELKLYKTGRTNANDGGIDFVMKPLGRFFQVTETLDFKKYFLDIEKVEKYPVTFVIKSEKSLEDLLSTLRSNAVRKYVIESIVDKYMECMEELINIPFLKSSLRSIESKGMLNDVLDEIILQSKVEFNYSDDD